MSWEELYNIHDNHKDEYVRVCGLCHAGIHWCMTALGLTWEDIMARRTAKVMFG